MKFPTFLSLAVLAAASVVMLSGGCTTPPTLQESAGAGYIDGVRSQIKEGANVNAKDANGNTPLHETVLYNLSYGYSKNLGDIVELLIQNGADVNIKNNVGQTPLSFASMFNAAELATLLIKNGANVNSVDTNGLTPLFCAKMGNHINVEKILIANGATAPTRSKAGRTVAEERDFQKQIGEQKTKEMKAQVAAQIEAAEEQRRQDKADRRDMLKGLATLGTGIAVGNATRGYSPDQQTRMMRSSMKAVDSGDTSELTETTNQVKAEQAQSHKARMQAVEAQKERDRAVQTKNNQTNRNSNTNTSSSRNVGGTQVASNKYGTGAAGSPVTEDWKPAFKSKTTLTDCANRARAMGGNCLHEEISKPAFVAADGSVAEQSKLCSEIKNRALKGDFYNIVEDFGCGCSWINGYLSCTYFTIGKSRHNSGGGGKEK